MPFSIKNNALINNFSSEDTDVSLEDILQKGRTGHFLKKVSGNMKHRPKSWER